MNFFHQRYTNNSGLNSEKKFNFKGRKIHEALSFHDLSLLYNSSQTYMPYLLHNFCISLVTVYSSPTTIDKKNRFPCICTYILERAFLSLGKLFLRARWTYFSGVAKVSTTTPWVWASHKFLLLKDSLRENIFFYNLNIKRSMHGSYSVTWGWVLRLGGSQRVPNLMINDLGCVKW